MSRIRNDGSRSIDLPSLVRSAMGGDRGAFDLLVDRYRERVYCLCYRMLRQVQDAEDATADTFLRAWLKRDTFNPEAGSSFEPWLLTVARNLCHRLLSERGERQSREVPGDTQSLTSRLEEDSDALRNDKLPWTLLKQKAAQAIDMLPERWRTAFSLLLQGYTYAEIARHLQISVSQVGVILTRTRQRLRAAIEGDLQATPGIRGTPPAPRDVHQDLEAHLRSVVTDFELVSVPLNRSGSSVQVWVPVLDLARQRGFQRETRALRRKVVRDPQNAEGWRLLAEQYRISGQLPRAVEGFERAWKVKSRRRMDREREVLVLLHLGDCLRQLERRSEAKRVFRRALRMTQPAEARNSMILGHLLALDRQNAEAIEYYRCALQKSTSGHALSSDECVVLRHRLAACLRANSRPDLAAKEYEAILSQDSSDATAHDLAADCYREIGDWDRTIASLERAYELVPHSARSMCHLAQKYVDTCYRLPRALELARRAVRLAPTSWECWKTFGQVCRRMGRNDEAHAAYERSVSLGGGSAEVWVYYAAYLQELGRHGDSLQALLQAHRMEPRNLVLWGAIGDTYLNLGYREVGRRWTRRLSRQKNIDWTLSHALSVNYCKLGDRAAAVRWAKQAASLSSNNPIALKAMGDVFVQMCEWRPAIANYRNALRRLRANGRSHLSLDIHFHLGRCYREVGDQARARRAFTRGLQHINALLEAGHREHGLQLYGALYQAVLDDLPEALRAASRILDLLNHEELRLLLKEIVRQRCTSSTGAFTQ